MRVLLVYYTGTYNTRFLTDRLEAHLRARGHETERVEIRRGTPAADAAGFDAVGFGYPIYGFNAPLPFERYVKKVRLAPGQKFFIYKNSGETFAMNNASSRILLRRMKRRKAAFAGEYHFVMPYNIHFPFAHDFVRELLQKDEKLLRVLVYDLEHGTPARIGSNPVYNAAAAAVSVQKIGGAVNSFFYRVDKDKCTLCGKCAKNCPEDNIRIERGRVRFGHRCDMCMRCSFFCPQNAVRIGFLEGWKVNGGYRLREALEEGPPDAPYITAESRGFYKCFIRHFADIDARYAARFPDGC